MDKKKLSIRPELNLGSIVEDENFQNKTLRPILKLQNDIILSVFSAFSKKQKTDTHTLNKEALNNYVNLVTKNNTVLRNQFIGIVIGQFTNNEFTTYKENDVEHNKRIVNMICQRILDNH
ncbi:MAG: glyoxalase [Polaribacter sp.]|nr:glyoxalase [Polaribacter sp.]